MRRISDKLKNGAARQTRTVTPFSGGFWRKSICFHSSRTISSPL